MATVAQFVNKPVVKPVTVISGPNGELRAYCLRFMLQQIRPSSVQIMSTTDTRWPQLAEQLYSVSPLDSKRVLCINDVQKWDSVAFDRMRLYAESPTDDTFLIIDADSIRRANKQRWIHNKPALKTVQYVDCGGMEDKTLLNFVRQATGLNQSDAERLIDSASAELSDVIRLMDLLYYGVAVSNERPAVSLVNQILPPVQKDSPLMRYGIPVVPNEGYALFGVLQRQFIRLLRLSLALREGVYGVKELAKHTGHEIFQVSRWKRIAERDAPEVWLKRLNLLYRSEQYVGNPFYTNYLELLLCSNRQL